MRVFDFLLAALGAAGLAALGVWSYFALPSFAKSYEGDLAARAEAMLADAGHNWAGVNVNGQSVQLTGAPPDEAAGAAAVMAVQEAAGPGGLIFGGITRVTPQFDDAPLVSPFVWRAARTANGKLVLTGHVPSATAQETLSGYIGDMDGLALDDRTTIARGVPDGDWPAIAQAGLSALVDLGSGEARLEDRTLTVAGLAMDTPTRARVSAQIANLSDPWLGIPDIAGPGRWAARHVQGTLKLDGAVTDETEREEILQIASAHYDGEIIDTMQVDGAAQDNWLDGVRLGLPHFVAFQTGQMGFDPDGAGGFTFDGAASGSTLAYLREDMATLEGPFSVDFLADEVSVSVSEIADVDFAADPRAACELAFGRVMETNRVVFETESAQISRESGATLDKIMSVAVQCAPTLSIELSGHTDSMGERAYNIYLSEQRAQAVADYMASRGFSSDRLIVMGYGPDQPIADNATPEGRALNRRLEFLVLEGNDP